MPTTPLYPAPALYADAYYSHRAGDYYSSGYGNKCSRYEGHKAPAYATQPSLYEVDVSRGFAFWDRICTPHNGDNVRVGVNEGTLEDYLKSDWCDHMSFDIILKYHEDYRYPENMKIRSRAKVFADRWGHIGSRGLVYYADSAFMAIVS